MKYLLIILTCASCLIGCESLPRGEMAYQTLHALDVLQTLDGSRDECYKEVNPVTRRIIGERPSQQSVVAWGAGSSLLHYGISSIIDRNAPPWVLATWQVATALEAGQVVVGNYEVGIRLGGQNDHSKLDNWCNTP